MRNFFRNLIAVCTLCAVGLLIAPTMVLAATVDLQPTAQLCVTYIFVALNAVGIAIIGIFAHGSIETRLRNALQTALEAAAAYASQKVTNADWTKLDIKNPIVALAVNYAQKAVPNALKWFGITPERLAEMVIARLAYFAPQKD